jgi:hypothetical protein
LASRLDSDALISFDVGSDARAFLILVSGKEGTEILEFWDETIHAKEDIKIKKT